VSTVVGRGPIPFSGLGRLGDPYDGPFGQFMGSADLVSIANQALGRYQNAIDTAQQACDEHSGFFQSVFDWATRNTSQQSICNAAAQMRMNRERYAQVVNDPNSTDDQIIEIIGFVQREVDVSDLLDLAKSTDWARVTGRAVLDAPGTVVGWAGQAAGQVAKGIAFNIPWWAWVLGAAFLATQLGWKPWKERG
jgi:hypothetical protein